MKSVLPAVCLLLSGALLAAQPAGTRLALAQEVCSAAREALEGLAKRKGLDAAVECPLAGPLEVPREPLSWRVVEERVGLVSGANRVTLRLVSGSHQRDVAVPVVLTLTSTAWIARHPIAAGATIDAGNVERREIQWPAGVVPQPRLDAPAGRARSFIRPGEIVSASRVSPVGERLQGDVVTVAFRANGIALEMPAVLVADAQIGDVARVQRKGRRETLEGVLVDAGTVVVER